MSESVNSGVKSKVAYSRFTWRGLENASIHVSLVFSVIYAVCIAAYGGERPELRQSLAFYA